MLETETPLVGDYDVVIALGGARQSNLDRTRYAAEAVKSGKASIKQLVVAGSSRALGKGEPENTANYAPNATTEFDLVAGAAKTVAQENPGLVTSMFYVEDEKAGTPAVLEGVLQALKDSGALKEGAKVAAVTTQIYQESTELDLARVARQFGVSETFAAGNPSDPKVVEARKPATYLSEILRTLKAANNGTVAEKAAKVAHAEKLAQVVANATRPEEKVLHEAEDGSFSIEEQDGNIRHQDADGSTWYSYQDGKSFSDKWSYNNDVYTVE